MVGKWIVTAVYPSPPEIFGSARVGVISATIHIYSECLICTTLLHSFGNGSTVWTPGNR